MSNNLADAIQFAIDQNGVGVHTALPAKIVTYNSTTNKAKVKPLIQKINQNYTLIPLPELAAVPVQWTGGATWGMKGPLVPGDIGLLIFAECSIDTWLSSDAGLDVEQNDPRRFDFSDAIFLPGLYPFSGYDSPETSDSEYVFYNGDQEIRITEDSIKLKSCQIAIGCETQSIELLDQISQLIAALQGAVTATSIGPQPLDPATQVLLAGIKSSIDTIAGTL